MADGFQEWTYYPVIITTELLLGLQLHTQKW